jgi:hypothetical protein
MNHQRPKVPRNKYTIPETYPPMDIRIRVKETSREDLFLKILTICGT